MEDGRYAGLPPEEEKTQDLEALAAQVECRYRERLRLFAARRLANVGEAEDVAQEAIRRALEAIRAGRVENLDGLPGFLFQTAKFICMQRARSARREGKALRTFAASGGPIADDPLLQLIRAERRQVVLNALARLEPDDRSLLEMSYGQDLDSAEIGRRLGLTPGAVRVRRHRTVRRLSELLGVTRRSDREDNE